MTPAPWNKLRPHAWLALAGVLCLAQSYEYAARGYHGAVGLLWLLSLLSGGVHFHRDRAREGPAGEPVRADLLLLLGLAVCLAPFYLFLLRDIPVQVNTDELVCLNVIRDTHRSPADPFGLSGWYYLPSWTYLAMGSVCKALGGIDLWNIRRAHALVGLGSVLLSYLFFRQLFASRLPALAAATLLGTNHSMIALSRIALHYDTALFVNLLAYLLLLRGFRKKCPFHSYLGGAALGACLYVYLSARMAALLWGSFLAVAWVRSESGERRLLLRSIVPCAAGFLLLAAPMLLTSARQWDRAGTMARSALLVYAQAREAQRAWYFAPSIAAGLRINAVQGLTLFNNRICDQAWFYCNRNHGFLDPGSGLLVWAGLLHLLRRRDKRPEHRFMIGGLLALWLAFAFLVNKAPNYGRLLILLPFVAFFATEGLGSVCRGVLHALARIGWNGSSFLRGFAFPGLIVLALVNWNLSIYGDYVRKGLEDGEEVGGTVRYVEGRKSAPRYSFLLASSRDYPYDWRNPADGALYWIRSMAGAGQEARRIAPEEVTRVSCARPFTLFMTGKLWSKTGPELTRLYPGGAMHSITTGAGFVALEVR